MNKLNSKTIDRLREIQDQLREIVAELKEASEGLNIEGQVNAYLLPAIEMAIDDEHDWLGSNQCTVQDLINAVSSGKETPTSSEEDEIEFPGRNVDAHQDAMDRAERGEMTHAEAEELGIDLSWDETEEDEDDGLTFDI